MHASTRRLALRAAAKVALSASFTLAGCGGTIQPQGEPPAPKDTPDATVAALGDATAADVPMAATTCAAIGIGVDASVSEGVFTCCVARVGALLGDAGFGRLSDAAAADPETLSCCNAIIARLTDDARNASPTRAADMALDPGATSACCETAGMFGGPACEAWGPPVPPPMPWAARAEVA
jgi:hypothetical protein